MGFKEKIAHYLERRHQHRLEKMIKRKHTCAILTLLNDRRESVRLDAVRALGFCSDDLAYHALLQLLRDPLASIRKAAALALSDMNHPDSAASIQRQISVEQDQPSIIVMHTALFRMKKNA